MLVGGHRSLLQAEERRHRLDLPELRHPAQRSHHLHPSVVLTGRNPIDLVERVVAILLVPQEAGARIDGQPKAVADAVGEDLLNVRADLAPDAAAEVEERIVPRRRAIVVEAENDAAEVGVVGLRPAKLVIRNPRTERPVFEVLRLPASAVVADDDEQPGLVPVVIAAIGVVVIVTAARRELVAIIATAVAVIAIAAIVIAAHPRTG